MDRSSSKTKVFLLELIIIILFFAIAAAVCVNLFVKAKIISDNSSDLTMAVLQGQKTAETVKGAPAGMEADLLEGFQPGGEGRYIAYYDKNWNPIITADKSVYQTETVFYQRDNLLVAEISVKKAQEVLFSITTEKFIEQNAGEEP